MTCTNNICCSKLPLPSGVSQGSNLGPPLILLLINDFPAVIQYTHIYLFADDLNSVCILLPNIETPMDFDSQLQWADDNGMEFDCTKFELFPQSNSTQSSALRLGEHPPIPVDQKLDLGLLIKKFKMERSHH